jgi:hypothetical protein
VTQGWNYYPFTRCFPLSDLLVERNFSEKCLSKGAIKDKLIYDESEGCVDRSNGSAECVTRFSF